jgi:ABC-type protease/lipase transport system fused ATPase/permease subunit
MALVGLPGVSGLSVEQRKRLTIAVELVSNPAIVFMDEPTSGLSRSLTPAAGRACAPAAVACPQQRRSNTRATRCLSLQQACDWLKLSTGAVLVTGLDARAAAIVMRVVRNIVNTGRTIACTIHQPAIDIFEVAPPPPLPV